MDRENCISQGTGASKDLILVHTVQLKQMIKAHFSGRLVTSGVSDAVIASVHYEKTRLKKFMKMFMIIIIIMKNCKKRRFLVGTRNSLPS